MVKPKNELNIIDSICDYDENANIRLKLDKNENIYGVSNIVMHTIKNSAEEDICFFPDISKCSHKLSDKYNINNDNLLLSSSRIDLIKDIINVYLGKDEYFIYYGLINNIISNQIKYCGGNALAMDFEEDFSFNKNKLTESINDSTKIIYISSPDNISGQLVKPSMIELLVKNYTSKLFVIDCSYINYAAYCVIEDFIDLTRKYDNIIILKSYSYDYAFAGLRFCFAIANSSIINELKKISTQSINAITLNCILAQENDKNKIKENKELNAKNRELLSEGLEQAGFKTAKSEADFILCNFLDYCDFYYKKFKNNGILVKKFNKDSKFSTFLRITVPKEGGVKFILELVKKKELLILNPDETIFDIKDSYLEAIKNTIENITKSKITKDRIVQIKNLGNHNSDLDLIKHILADKGYYINDETLKIFDKEIKQCINNTKLLLSKEKLEGLSGKYDIALVTDHSKEEVEYLLQKFDIFDFYSFLASCNNIGFDDEIEFSYKNIFKVIKHSPYTSVKLAGANVDDILSANAANIEAIGVTALNENENIMVNNFKHLGVKQILRSIEELF